MPFFLLALFLKAPRWLRVTILLGLFSLFLFGCFYAATVFHNATERKVPAHVYYR